MLFYLHTCINVHYVWKKNIKRDYFAMIKSLLNIDVQPAFSIESEYNSDHNNKINTRTHNDDNEL